MFHIYQTVNLINGKIYVGVSKHNYHNYLGSGFLLHRAIKKYGKENFVKEILFIFDSEKEMYGAERKIVNQDFVDDRNTYNLKIGGIGSKGLKCSQETREKLRQALQGRNRSTETKQKISKTLKGHKHSKETKEKISLSMRGCNHPNFGKSRSTETKDKIRKGNIGYIWITNEIESTRINKNNLIPEGWYRGRA